MPTNCSSLKEWSTPVSIPPVTSCVTTKYWTQNSQKQVLCQWNCHVIFQRFLVSRIIISTYFRYENRNLHSCWSLQTKLFHLEMAYVSFQLHRVHLWLNNNNKKVGSTLYTAKIILCKVWFYFFRTLKLGRKVNGSYSAKYLGWELWLVSHGWSCKFLEPHEEDSSPWYLFQIWRMNKYQTYSPTEEDIRDS